MPSMVFGVFLRAIYTFKTLNCAVAYGLWGDFWHLGGGHGPLAPPKSAYGDIEIMMLKTVIENY